MAEDIVMKDMPTGKCSRGHDVLEGQIVGLHEGRIREEENYW